jgi:hypothetical protein
MSFSSRSLSMRAPAQVAALSLSLLLAACGGGGGGGGAAPPPAVPDVPAVACATTDVTWTAGQKTCGATVAEAASGLSALVDDATEPTIGKASFLCTNGTWGEQASPAAECIEVPPPVVPPCPARTLKWAVNSSTCSAEAPQTTAGSTLQFSDVTAPTTGAATFFCPGGDNWELQAGSATCVTNVPPPPPPVTCPASLQSWTVNGNTCDAPAPQTNTGSSLTLRDNVAPSTGDALFACSGGTWTQRDTPPATCVVPVEPPPPPPPPPPPLAECAAGALNWTVAGQACNAEAPRTSSGSSLSLTDSVAPTTGTALFSCSDGDWSQRATPPATCVLDTPPPPPPADCTPTNMKWGTAPDLCNAVSPQTTSGSTIQLFDDLEPTQGSAAFACNNGSLSLQAFPTPQCVVDVPPPPQEACEPKDVVWSVAGRVCNASAPNAQSGTFASLVDNVGSTIGDARFVCVNGAWLPHPQPAFTCVVVQPPPLPPLPESLK